ncbi:hypothetical protein BDU57DRAFT_454763 [Ampelomyces quisqualis]|uniref:CFEM domain-containing protein n=1 Tax=Ampelomyces quisqualis TaxID=50730 RepID=A0A6A5QJ88_AMPQU|nr:hypothetical protein BDU57DRAFT_454763 [Ampelomyces quisqualis]
MRFAFVAAVAAFGPMVLAQNLLGQIPQCAQTCFGNNLGSCGVADIACICGNTAVIDRVSCCVFASCSQADIAATTQFAVTLCKVSNINVNTAPVCPSAASDSAMSTGSMASSVSASRSAASASSASTASASAAATTGAAAGAGVGLGVAMAGLLAAL